MSVLAIDRVLVEPPAVLPVDHLSLSSIKQFQMCPLKWKRSRLDHDPEPTSGKMILGSAAGAALAQHFGLVIERGEGLSTDDVLDEFATEWEDRIGREEVDFEKDTPGELKDSGAGALRVYHSQFAPAIEPIAVEREFELSWPGVDWTFTGFIDLEDAANLVRDYKMTSKRISQSVADGDLQTTVYLAARRAEGDPADGFRFDTMVRNKQPIAEIVSTSRTDAQLDHLTERVFAIARDIAWRTESDNWIGASPGTWFCGSCRYHDCSWRVS